jgi:hypothetical protein
MVDRVAESAAGGLVRLLCGVGCGRGGVLVGGGEGGGGGAGDGPAGFVAGAVVVSAEQDEVVQVGGAVVAGPVVDVVDVVGSV